MTKLMAGTCLSVLIVAFAHGQSTFGAETLEEIKKAIAEKTVAVQSATYETESTVYSGPTARRDTVSKTTKKEILISGDRALYRDEITNTYTYSNGNKHAITELVVGDGQFVWTMRKDGNDVSVKKVIADPWTANDSLKFDLKPWEKSGLLKVLPSESINGEEFFVFAMASPQSGGPRGLSGPRSIKIHISKTTGMLMRYLEEDTVGTYKKTLTVTNFKLNPAIAADRFKFTPPAGAKIDDRTQEK